jgi:universal stress protein A
MNSFNKILVPVDFSPHSDKAIQTAADLARRYEAPLSLLHVYEPVAYALPEGYVMHTADQLVQLLAELSKSLDRARELAVQAGAPTVDAKQVDGVAHREVVEYARTGGYDLIVMGSHGRKGLDRLLMGSVAEKVVRNAPCSVLCVRSS